MSRAMRMALTLSEHIDAGAKLKRARCDLLEVADDIARCHPRLAERLQGIADQLIAPRAELERKLIEAVGENGMVEGIPCREVYFGPEQVEEKLRLSRRGLRTSR